MQHVSAGGLQSGEIVGNWNSDHEQREKEQEGRKEEEDELFGFCLWLFAPVPKFSKWFQTSTSFERRSEAGETHRWTKWIQFFHQSL